MLKKIKKFNLKKKISKQTLKVLHKNIFKYKKKKFKKNNNLNFKKIKFIHFLKFKIKSNNFFCNINKLSKKKNYFKIKNNLISTNAGTLKFKVSKKNLRYFIKPFIISLFTNYLKKKKVSIENTIISIEAPKKLRKKLFYLLKYNYKKKIL